MLSLSQLKYVMIYCKAVDKQELLFIANGSTSPSNGNSLAISTRTQNLF
jgi:hypothetical protein